MAGSNNDSNLPFRGWTLLQLTHVFNVRWRNPRAHRLQWVGEEVVAVTPSRIHVEDEVEVIQRHFLRTFPPARNIPQ